MIWKRFIHFGILGGVFKIVTLEEYVYFFEKIAKTTM